MSSVEQRRLLQLKARRDMLGAVREQREATVIKQQEDKKKKNKKDKKKKKKKKRKRSSSSSSSSSDSEEWEEASAATKPAPVEDDPIEDPTSQPPERDDWMQMTTLGGVFSRDELRLREGTSRVLAKQLQKKKQPDKPGSNARELNPYYKSGGTGLPPTSTAAGNTTAAESSSQPSIAPSFSAGASAAWLRKSLQRAKEQAEEEQKPFELIAEERWGSLDKFYEMLRVAEERDELARKADRGQVHSNNSGERRSFARPRNSPDRRFRDRESPDRRTNTYSRDRRSPDRRSRDYRHHRKTRDSKSPDSKYNVHSPHRRRRSVSSSSSSNSSDSSQSSTKKYRKNKRSHRRHSSGSAEESDEGRQRRNSSPDSRRSKPDNYKSRKPVSPLARGSGRRRSPSPQRPRMLRPGERKDNVDERRQQRECAVWDEPSKRTPYDSSRASGSSGWRKRKQETTEQPSMERQLSTLSTSGQSEDNTSKTEFPSSFKASEKVSISSNAPQPSYQAPQSPSHDNDAKQQSTADVILSENELNKLASKLVKAEIMGNAALVDKLNKKLAKARAAAEAAKLSGADDSKTGAKNTQIEEVLLTATNSKGVTRPLACPEDDDHSQKKKSRKKLASGVDGEREKYFPDDHKFSLKQLFVKEKLSDASDTDAMFMRAAARTTAKLDDDYTLDDSFVDRSAMREDSKDVDSRERLRAIMEHQKREKVMRQCQHCMRNLQKHLIVSNGGKSYLSVPCQESMVQGHCLIVPKEHTATCTLLDEDTWEEMKRYKQSLVRYFDSRDEDVLFLECCMRLNSLPHTVIHCIPLPKELGTVAPIYYKKAIQECESEWNQNKKLVDLAGRDVRRAIPKGFPYFAVDFGNQPGYAHVIEDEELFPIYFGLSIVGGMLDLEPYLWRKPRQEKFSDQSKKVLEFTKQYEKYDPEKEQL